MLYLFFIRNEISIYHRAPSRKTAAAESTYVISPVLFSGIEQLPLFFGFFDFSDFLENNLNIDRLGDMSVHTSFQTFSDIFGEGIRRHGDDWYSSSLPIF